LNYPLLAADRRPLPRTFSGSLTLLHRLLYDKAQSTSTLGILILAFSDMRQSFRADRAISLRNLGLLILVRKHTQARRRKRRLSKRRKRNIPTGQRGQKLVAVMGMMKMTKKMKRSLVQGLPRGAVPQKQKVIVIVIKAYKPTRK
jgi:hypothetical protein